MQVARKLRACDEFGSPFGLKHGGETSFKTLGGGIATLVLKITALAYLCMRLIAVVTYGDPVITLYDIQDDRSKTNETEPYNMADYNAQFYFGFLDHQYSPVPLDARIGRLFVNTIYMWYEDGQQHRSYTSPEVMEVNLGTTEDDKVTKMFPMFNENNRGMFTVSNYDELNLSGSFFSSPQRSVVV